MNIDMKLTQDNADIYDINIDTNGDLELVDNFDTAILLSLFTDKGLDESEQPVPQLRGGWWGNILSDIPNYEMGSKFWALDYRRTQETLNQTEDYGLDCVNWFKEDNILKDIQAEASFDDNNLILELNFIRFNNQIDKRFYILWENTF